MSSVIVFPVLLIVPTSPIAGTSTLTAPMFASLAALPALAATTAATTATTAATAVLLLLFVLGDGGSGSSRHLILEDGKYGKSLKVGFGCLNQVIIIILGVEVINLDVQLINHGLCVLTQITECVPLLVEDLLLALRFLQLRPLLRRTLTKVNMDSSPLTKQQQLPSIINLGILHLQVGLFTRWCRLELNEGILQRLTRLPVPHYVTLLYGSEFGEDDLEVLLLRHRIQATNVEDVFRSKAIY